MWRGAGVRSWRVSVSPVLPSFRPFLKIPPRICYLNGRCSPAMWSRRACWHVGATGLPVLPVGGLVGGLLALPGFGVLVCVSIESDRLHVWRVGRGCRRRACHRGLSH